MESSKCLGNHDLKVKFGEYNLNSDETEWNNICTKCCKLCQVIASHYFSLSCTNDETGGIKVEGNQCNIV